MTESSAEYICVDRVDWLSVDCVRDGGRHYTRVSRHIIVCALSSLRISSQFFKAGGNNFTARSTLNENCVFV